MDATLVIAAEDSFSARPALVASEHRTGWDWPALLWIVALTLLTRTIQFGNPVFHIDDEFYLYVGHSILSGELPYVDIWDRKPIGLYLIYAAAAAIGNGVIAYQTLAAIFVLATSLCIFQLAKLITNRRGALFAALLYPVLILPIGGAAGQAPVFYNLFMAAAAFLTLQAIVAPVSVDRRRAAAAMLLCGAALTVKPVTVFEGIAFGILLLMADWRRGGNWLKTMSFGGRLIATAILPTAAAYLFYAMLGHAGEMWQATVTSVFQKGATSSIDRLTFASLLIKTFLIPFMVAGCSLGLLIRRRGWSPETEFLAAWCAAALMGFIAIPNFFDHYALPLAIPACVAMAPLLGYGTHGKVLFGAAAISFAALGFRVPYLLSKNHFEYSNLVLDVRASLGEGCLYVHYGPPQLYIDANACRVTRFAFPDHLETEIEADALPVRAEVEMKRIFDSHRPPQLIVTGRRDYLSRNWASEAILQAHLECEYRSAGWYQTSRNYWVHLWVREPRRPPHCGFWSRYNRS